MVNNLVEIGGQKRPVNFGRNSLVEFEKLTGVKIFKGDDWFDSLEKNRAFIYVGLKWGLYRSDKGIEPKPDFTLFQVGDWMEETPNALIEVMNVFTESMPKAEKKSEEASE